MLTGLLHSEAFKPWIKECVNSLRKDSHETGALPTIALVPIILSWSVCFALFFNKSFMNAGVFLLSFIPSQQ